MRVDQLTIGPDLVCEVRIKTGIQNLPSFPPGWDHAVSVTRHYNSHRVSTPSLGCPSGRDQRRDRWPARFLLPLVCDESSHLRAISTTRQRNQKRGLRTLLLRQEEHYLLFYSPRYGVRRVRYGVRYVYVTLKLIYYCFSGV